MYFKRIILISIMLISLICCNSYKKVDGVNLNGLHEFPISKKNLNYANKLLSEIGLKFNIDEASWIQESMDFLIFSKQVPIYQLDEVTDLLIDAVAQNGIDPYYSIISEFGFRYNRIDSEKAKSKFKDLSNIYYKTPVRKNQKALIILDDFKKYNLFDNNIAILITELIYSDISNHFEDLALYDKIDLVSLGIAIANCNNCVLDGPVELGKGQCGQYGELIENSDFFEKRRIIYENQNGRDKCRFLDDIKNRGYLRGSSCIIGAFNEYQSETDNLAQMSDRFERYVSCTYNEALSNNQFLDKYDLIAKRGKTKVIPIRDEQGRLVRTIFETPYKEKNLAGESENYIENKIVEHQQGIIRTETIGDRGYVSIIEENSNDNSEYIYGKVKMDDGSWREYQSYNDKDITVTMSRKENGNWQGIYYNKETGVTTTWEEDENGNIVEGSIERIEGEPEELPNPLDDSSVCESILTENLDPTDRGLDRYTMPDPNEPESNEAAEQFLQRLNSCLNSDLVDRAKCDFLVRCAFDDCNCGIRNLSNEDWGFSIQCDNIIQCPEDSVPDEEGCGCKPIRGGLVVPDFDGGIDPRFRKTVIPINDSIIDKSIEKLVSIKDSLQVSD